MSNTQYWDSLSNFCYSFRKFIDAMWKVWGWFGIAIVSGVVHNNPQSSSALAFLAFVTGVLYLVAWFLERQIEGLTEKGRNSNWLLSLSVTGVFLYLAVYFSVSIGDLISSVALRVFS